MGKSSNPTASQGGEFDMFGAPVTQIRERWGRPNFRKTKENQEAVGVLRAAGWSHERIAGYLGCDAKTLRKHYSRELAKGADIVEGMALIMIYSKMRQGSSPAANKLLDIIDAGKAAPPPRDAGKAEKIGKKEQATREAGVVPDEWGDVLTPNSDTAH